MNSPSSIKRYNQPIPDMRARTPSGLRPDWLILFLLVTSLLPTFGHSSALGDTAHQLAHKIASATGPGAFVVDVINRSSLDDKSVREVRTALEAQLDAEGVHTAKSEQAMGTVSIIFSESLREYVWTAQIAVGSDERKVALVSTARPPTSLPFAAALPIVVKRALLFSQDQKILDIAVDSSGGSRLIVLNDSAVAIYHRQGAESSPRWELESSLPISHSRTFPRDLRGRILLRRDHLFDVYLPGMSCRSGGSAPLSIICNENNSDLWPMTSADDGVQGHFATARNFFTGALSPGIGKISNVPPFYSFAALTRSKYTLWALATTDGSLHLVDGMTDQLIRGTKWGSDIAAVHSGCGSGMQLLASESGNEDIDSLRAFEIPDREPVAASPALEFDGQITALWPATDGNSAVAIVKRNDTNRYEAYAIFISCGN